MHNKRAKKFAMILAIVMAGLMLFGIIAMLIPPAGARVTEAQIKEQQDRVTSLGKDKQRAEEQIARLQNERRSTIAIKEQYDLQIEIAENEIESVEVLLEMLAFDIEIKEEQLAAAIEDERVAYRQYLARVRALGEQPPQ